MQINVNYYKRHWQDRDREKCSARAIYFQDNRMWQDRDFIQITFVTSWPIIDRGNKESR